jgi:hypothetical protein
MVGNPSFLARVLQRQRSRHAEKTPVRRLSLSTYPPAINAVGDVRSCLDQYRAQKTKIDEDGGRTSEPKLIGLPDVIVELAPLSRALIDCLPEPAPSGFQRVIQMGNQVPSDPEAGQKHSVNGHVPMDKVLFTEARIDVERALMRQGN